MDVKSGNNFLWNILPRLLQYGTSLITSIILARLLSADDYGIIAMANVFYIVLNVFVWDGLGNGLIQRKQSDGLDFSSVFVFNIILSLFIYALIFFLAPILTNFLNYPRILTSVLRILSLRVVFSSALSVQNAYVSRNLLFTKRVIPFFVASIISAGIGIALAFLGYGVWALVFQYLIGTVLESIGLIFSLKWFPNLRFSARRLKPIVSFSWKILAESLISNTTAQLRSFLIGKEYDSASLGYYSKGQQFPNLLSNCFCVPLNATLFPMIANIKENKSGVVILLRKTLRISTFILLPLFAFICCTANEWVVIVLTEKWINIVAFVWIFSVCKIFDIGIFILNAALTGLGYSGQFMKTNVAIKIIDIIIMILCITFGTYIIAATMVITNALLFVFVCRNTHKYVGYKYNEQVYDIIPFILMILPSMALTLLISFLPIESIIVKFILEFFVFWLSYVFSAKILKCAELNVVATYIGNIVSKLKRK